ncbi:MAG: adenylate/guanylate cyclase domain-containing protein [Planctomycetes bacterium]|nr:adenylate/guanylate cyclase domain-containing protein [Planctomycetota bacterium]
MTDLPPSDETEEKPEEQRLAASVLFYHHHKRVFATPLDTRLEIGRQRANEPEPRRRIDLNESARIVLTPLDDVDVSRTHLALIPQAKEGMVEVVNLSRTQPVHLGPNEILNPGQKTIAEIPLLVQFSGYAVRVEPPEDEDLDLRPLPERTIVPGRMPSESGLGRVNLDSLDEQLLLRWLETILGVFQSAANSSDFSELAAKAIVNIVGLDSAAMLECDAEGRWRTAALHSVVEGQNEETWVPSRTLLAQVRKERRTYRHVPANVSDTAHSLQDVSALVAAPILDGENNVIGALYGDRRSSQQTHAIPDISPFEAKLVEVLASGIAAGLARMKEEQAAMAARVQFEQFFTPQLAKQLEEDPRLLEGRDAQITLLFADICEFSRLSERLGPARTMAWIQDTLGALSECVLAHDGVLVDYMGDELMAMWGAPIAQADHAELACRAAQQMIRALPAINERWEAELGAPVRLGIGINSGVARVGNTGTRQKFKYGPLGDTVNIASRVRGASKYLGANCLMTGSTLAELSSPPELRRLARVRVVNIVRPIDIYELQCSKSSDWASRKTRYEEALTTLESCDLGAAVRLSQQLAAEFPDDMAAMALAERVDAVQHSEQTSDCGIWHLPGK